MERNIDESDCLHKYGPPKVLHFQEVEKPALDEEKVLANVHAASINTADWHMLTADALHQRSHPLF